MIKKSLLALLPIAILAIGWYFVQNKNTSPDSFSTDNVSTKGDSSSVIRPTQSAATENPLKIREEATSPIAESPTKQNIDQIVDTRPAISTNPIEASSIAIEPLTDAEFVNLEALLKNDRQLRLSLLEEFRYNTNPTRAKQLAALLGPYDDPEILQIASELVYSGDPQSSIAGLDLLSRIQPRSDEARNIAIDLLNTGDSSKMLIATMNVLATPSKNASTSQLQILNDNLNNLSNHYDPNVRSQSMSLLGRWDKNSAIAREAFSNGLNDSDPAVRSSATFAINNISNPDITMITSLLGIAENAEENRSTRYAALRALENMQLSATQQRRYSVAKRSANRR